MSDAQTDSLRFASVRLATAGKRHVSAMDGGDGSVRVGTPVVVQTAQGEVFGSVQAVLPSAVDSRLPLEARQLRVLRTATSVDLDARARAERRETDARRVAQAKIRERGLSMKLSRVEQSMDGARLTFYFTADARVDFRELVRDLASAFHTRIEMRHIGVRDEAQMLGGYGTCGRPLCCSTFLTSFAPVSIKMAKQQNVNLGPSKLTGMCGRLKCCLRFEATEDGPPGPTAAGGPARRACGCSGGCSGGCSSGTCRCR